jgi:hypothetical protein
VQIWLSIPSLRLSSAPPRRGAVIAANDDACGAAIDERWPLNDALAVATTIAGMRAMLSYLVEYSDGYNLVDCGEVASHLLRPPVFRRLIPTAAQLYRPAVGATRRPFLFNPKLIIV